MTQNPDSMDITRMLDAMAGGDDSARGELLTAIYDELHRLASAQMSGERNDHTLQPTALVHESYLRLLTNAQSSWVNRSHFFGAAVEAMRRILVDHARARQAAKRGGDRQRMAMEDIQNAVSNEPEELLAIDAALSELESLDADKAAVVRLRFFGGLSVDETAAATGISARSVKRHWRFAKAWLFRRLSDPDGMDAD